MYMHTYAFTCNTMLACMYCTCLCPASLPSLSVCLPLSSAPSLTASRHNLNFPSYFSIPNLLATFWPLTSGIGSELRSSPAR